MRKLSSMSYKLFTLAFVLLFSIISLCPQEAQADTGWLNEAVNYNKKQTLYVSPKDGMKYNMWTEVLFTPDKNISAQKIKNIKSSNKSVLQVSKVYNEKSGSKKAVVMDVWVKKAGSATVSFKYGAKTYKLKHTMKKFSNGLKSVKLGGFSGDYAAKFNSRLVCEKDDLKKVPSSITVKTKSNWKVTEISFVSAKARNWKTIFSSKKRKTSVTVKKDKAFTTSMDVVISCFNKKTGEEAEYWLDLSPAVNF